MWRADNGNINLVHPPDWSALLMVSDASLRSLSMLAHLGDASFERLVLALEEAVVRELDLTESSPAEEAEFEDRLPPEPLVLAIDGDDAKAVARSLSEQIGRVPVRWRLEYLAALDDLVHELASSRS